RQTFAAPITPTIPAGRMRSTHRIFISRFKWPADSLALEGQGHFSLPCAGVSKRKTLWSFSWSPRSYAINPRKSTGKGSPLIATLRYSVSACGKEAGLKPEDVKTLLRHEDIATTSNMYGDIGMLAKRPIQERLWSS